MHENAWHELLVIQCTTRWRHQRFLNNVKIVDLQTQMTYYFLCESWVGTNNEQWRSSLISILQTSDEFHSRFVLFVLFVCFVCLFVCFVCLFFLFVLFKCFFVCNLFVLVCFFFRFFWFVLFCLFLRALFVCLFGCFFVVFCCCFFRLFVKLQVFCHFVCGSVASPWQGGSGWFAKIFYFNLKLQIKFIQILEENIKFLLQAEYKIKL